MGDLTLFFQRGSNFCLLVFSFYQRDALHSTIFADVICLFGPSGSPIILVFLTPVPIPEFQGNPISGGTKYMEWVEKFGNF